jgi:hypothetical protein
MSRRWPEEFEMEISLSYRGPLPGGGDHVKAYKTRIRQELHYQLAGLCERNEHFRQASDEPLPEAKMRGNRVELIDPPAQPVQGMGTVWGHDFFRVPLSGVDFIPLLTRKNYRVAELALLLWRRSEPGNILQPDGDIDNRLKTLFDALRMPHSVDEIDSGSLFKEGRCYCLLEDDSLITKLTVSTHKTYRPPPSELTDTEASIYVELNMIVTVKATFPTIRNMGLGL